MRELRETLGSKLVQLQARQEGICQKRRELYSQVEAATTPSSSTLHPQSPPSTSTLHPPPAPPPPTCTSTLHLHLPLQALDELIRQTTLSCVERGLLLLRVKDEARMTLHAYQVLLLPNLPGYWTR